MAYPKCEHCGCTWHGLPCAKAGCPCVGAFDDDYWNERPA